MERVVVRVDPAVSLRGDLAVPGDKSISHRSLLFAAIADGTSEIRGFGRSADTESTMGALRALGVEIVEHSDEEIEVHGVGLRGLKPPDGPIDCGNSGTLVRLLAAILAGQTWQEFELTGDESLRSRPMDRVARPLREMGAGIESADGRLPLGVQGRPLHPIRYELPVASAQVKSAILLAGLYADAGPTTVVEPAVTRDHSERMLAAMGARVQRKPGEISIWPVERLAPLSIEVPGDISSAAPFIVAATLVPDSELRLHGVNVNSTRTGLLDVLERMGARISLYNRRTVSGEPVADIEVVYSELVATTIGAQEVPLLVDEIPLFCLLASLAHGNSGVRGAEDLRAKESDRIETTTDALRTVGAHIEARRDGFRIRGVPTRLRGGEVDAAGDHRIAMLGAIAGLASAEGIAIRDAACVEVSFPGFFDLLDSVTLR